MCCLPLDVSRLYLGSSTHALSRRLRRQGVCCELTSSNTIVTGTSQPCPPLLSRGHLISKFQNAGWREMTESGENYQILRKLTISGTRCNNSSPTVLCGTYMQRQRSLPSKRSDEVHRCEGAPSPDYGRESFISSRSSCRTQWRCQGGMASRS